MRTHLYADPAGKYLHAAILDSCSRFGNKTALVDTSELDRDGSAKRISYAELGELIVAAAHGLVAGGMKPGDRVGIFLPNLWEFCVASHAITLAGGIPSPLNPSYREREVRFQLRDSGAAFLITTAPLISGIEFSDLSQLRRIYTTRQHAGGSTLFADLLNNHSSWLPTLAESSAEALAALPYSSGTTGLPKGVRL